MKKAVIFDMDGVIIDSEPIHFESDKQIMLDYGHVILNEELNNYVGVSNPEMWTKLKEKYNIPATIDELLQRQMDHKKSMFGSRELHPVDGIKELLRALEDSGVQIGLASSSPKEFIELILKNLVITEYFKVIVSGEEVKRSKPAPDIFIKASEMLGVPPLDCIVIEDSEHGVRAAIKAGMYCIGYRNPNSGNQNLTLADIQVSSIKEIDYKKLISDAIYK